MALFRFHREVMDPGRCGPGLAAARCLLGLAAGVYGLVVRGRNLLYDRGWKRSHSADVPVISVGNITAGGTGKTPLVAWLSQLLSRHGLRPVILSRGYGRDDENRMLAGMAGGAPIVVNPDRVAGARMAVAGHGADVLLLDDGFQHRRIARDLNVVLVDALRPFGADWLLPRGLLREPLSGLRRADLILVTRADLVPEERVEAIVQELSRLTPGTLVATCCTAITGLRSLDGGQDLSPAALSGGRWAAFCGIGNPDGFRATLERAGCTLAAFTAFRDHEPYNGGQPEQLLAEAASAGCDGVLTTEKDAVKLERFRERAARSPLYAVATELEFVENGPELEAAVLSVAGATHEGRTEQ